MESTATLAKEENGKIFFFYMEPPRQVEDYFRVVHDFLYKSFRDDCKVFFGLRSTHRTHIETSPAELSTSEVASPQPLSKPVLSEVQMSPRVLIREDGSTYGKLKVALKLHVPQHGDIEQKLTVGSDGKAIGSLYLDQFIEGAKVGGRVALNAIAPATEDESTIEAKIGRGDFYGSVALNRNGFGSTATIVHVGAKFQALILGVGHTRRQYSLGEADQRAVSLTGPPLSGPVDHDTQTYVGGGFHGKSWTFGGRLIRVNDLWSCADLALFRKLSPSTAVAVAYGFDMSVSKAHVTLGASQGLWVRLPALLSMQQPSQTQVSGGSFATVLTPFVFGVKADSYGNVLTTLRGFLAPHVQLGVVLKRNLCDANSAWGLGVSLLLDE